jgi:hypothetical protein
MRRVSIRAVPQNSRICQGNPDNAPCRDHGGELSRVYNADVAQEEESCAQP